LLVVHFLSVTGNSYLVDSLEILKTSKTLCEDSWNKYLSEDTVNSFILIGSDVFKVTHECKEMK
jgi:hypothetical protein